MPKFFNLVKLLRDQKAGTAVEYGFILALIFLAMVSAVSGFANQFQSTLNTTSSRIGSAEAQAGA